LGATGGCAAFGDESFSLGQWRTISGERVPPEIVQTQHGEGHCSTQDVWAVVFGRDGGSLGRLYLRDPDGVINSRLLPGREPIPAFVERASLPAEAVDTGYRSGDVELWLDSTGDAAYLVFEDRVEMWPFAENMDLGCD
jgi:hypothetical protein